MYDPHPTFKSHDKYGTRYGVYKVSDYLNPDVYVFQGGQVPKPVMRAYDRLKDLCRNSSRVAIATLYREFGSSNSQWWKLELHLGNRRVAFVNFANDTEEFYIRKNGTEFVWVPVTRATFNRKTREALK